MALMSIQTNTGPCRCAHGTLPLHSGKVGISQKRPDGEPAAAARGPSKCQRQYYVVVLEQLLEGGIDVNAVDWKGRPALYFACARGDGAAAKMLLSKGADVDAAFHIARWQTPGRRRFPARGRSGCECQRPQRPSAAARDQ